MLEIFSMNSLYSFLTRSYSWKLIYIYITLQQNEIVERKHRHFLDVAVPLSCNLMSLLLFWGQCILTATYLITRLPSSILNNKTPFQILFDKSPSISLWKVVECLCYATTLGHIDKFAPRATPCVFMGILLLKRDTSYMILLLTIHC